ncbi:MBL fold metallo-hydrolase [Anaerobium acetethylicum]|uniref:Glyoxylase, beta-lactamase superfamily II n=1 Tax=Anaerobium acetethylicum TaxID=1619234 RepID=A0A1D3TR62_9FIRM|nr:MBL fold metallo-hydrolase [Anaerobium acetethylicum]SCP96152.1 Glyoxylase, beta-lactamase superfamily II [Anaerobium acetethylicum]
MEFKQVYTAGLAHCSYVIGGRNACIVVDPAREVDQYIEIAASFGLPIKGIIETHLHADFVSGHIELAEKTGATIYISAKAGAEYEHYAMADEEEIILDTLLVRMIETPGHTPEGAVFLVSDLERGKVPALAFTGDTLLVGDAGRPDLFPDRKEELALSLYKSLRRIEQIGGHVEMYPAHGAGSLCGKALSSKLSSTIGTEKMYNYAMQINTEEEFASTFLENMMEAPDHFSRCSEINRKGPARTDEMPKPVPYKPKEFLELAESGYLVVDARDQLPFAGAHVPGAYGLSLKGNFATFAGWVLPPDKPILLVADSSGDLDTAVKMLRRVGLDQIAGYLNGGMPEYAASGLKTAYFSGISVTELKERLERNELVLIDTRLKSEWDAGHIEGAVHAPAPDVRNRYEEWIGDKPVAFICSTGNRSLLATSLMMKLSGKKDVINVIGGVKAWMKAGFPIV